MQEISEHFALHFTTANVSFLQILHRIDKPFSVFFVLVPADSCHIQHFLLASRFQNAHMDEGFVGKDHIRRNFFLSGDLQTKRAEFLEKWLILFRQFTNRRFGKPAPFIFFLRFLLFRHFHCEGMILLQKRFRRSGEFHNGISVIGQMQIFPQYQIIRI